MRQLILGVGFLAFVWCIWAHSVAGESKSELPKYIFDLKELFREIGINRYWDYSYGSQKQEGLQFQSVNKNREEKFEEYTQEEIEQLQRLNSLDPFQYINFFKKKLAACVRSEVLRTIKYRCNKTKRSRLTPSTVKSINDLLKIYDNFCVERRIAIANIYCERYIAPMVRRKEVREEWLARMQRNILRQKKKLQKLDEQEKRAKGQSNTASDKSWLIEK